MENNIIYYLFSSITFLQLYIPLVIESKKRGYNNIFIVRENKKKSADPLNNTNFKILEDFLKKYSIKKIYHNDIDLNLLEGIIFMVDGDIYGPPRDSFINDSLLFTLNKKNTIKISLTEHMNFWDIYHEYINDVDYCFFSNRNQIDQMSTFKNKINQGKKLFVDTSLSYNNNKNIFLGNTKYDNIIDKNTIFKKYNLDPNTKYCLFLFPKIRKKFKNDDILNIYNHLIKLNFKIIVISRPKDKPISDDLKGNLFICSDTYPNESLELMKISQLVLISSSSANEETLFSEVPCIDLISDSRDWERNQYLLDKKTYIRIENKDWKNISFDNFNKIYKHLAKKNSKYFNSLKKKYLFLHKNSASNFFNFIENNII